jgi:hypothetical protein
LLCGIKKVDPEIEAILMSGDEVNSVHAKAVGCDFLYKLAPMFFSVIQSRVSRALKKPDPAYKM